MLTINTISGILNLMTNGGLGTHSGTTIGSQNQSHTLGSGGDLSATQIVSAPSAAQASSSTGDSTTGGGATGGGMTSGGFAGTAQDAPKAGTTQDASTTKKSAEQSLAQLDTEAQKQTRPDVNGTLGQVVEADLTAKATRLTSKDEDAISAADQSRVDRITERLLTAMATRSFKEMAAQFTAPEIPATEIVASERRGDLETTPNDEASPAVESGSGSSALAVQERLIRAELHAKLSQMAKTQDVGPADALRMMAGHNPQFPLEDPNA